MLRSPYVYVLVNSNYVILLLLLLLLLINFNKGIDFSYFHVTSLTLDGFLLLLLMNNTSNY